MTTSRPFQVNEYGNTNEQKAGSVPLAEYLAGFHIIVNCVLQDTDAPLMFVTDEELALFGRGFLVSDVHGEAACAEALK